MYVFVYKEVKVLDRTIYYRSESETVSSDDRFSYDGLYLISCYNAARLSRGIEFSIGLLRVLVGLKHAKQKTVKYRAQQAITRKSDLFKETYVVERCPWV